MLRILQTARPWQFCCQRYSPDFPGHFQGTGLIGIYQELETCGRGTPVSGLAFARSVFCLLQAEARAERCCPLSSAKWQAEASFTGFAQTPLVPADVRGQNWVKVNRQVPAHAGCWIFHSLLQVCKGSYPECPTWNHDHSPRTEWLLPNKVMTVCTWEVFRMRVIPVSHALSGFIFEMPLS